MCFSYTLNHSAVSYAQLFSLLLLRVRVAMLKTTATVPPSTPPPPLFSDVFRPIGLSAVSASVAAAAGDAAVVVGPAVRRHHVDSFAHSPVPLTSMSPYLAAWVKHVHRPPTPTYYRPLPFFIAAVSKTRLFQCVSVQFSAFSPLRILCISDSDLPRAKITASLH